MSDDPADIAWPTATMANIYRVEVWTDGDDEATVIDMSDVPVADGRTWTIEWSASGGVAFVATDANEPPRPVKGEGASVSQGGDE